MKVFITCFFLAVCIVTPCHLRAQTLEHTLRALVVDAESKEPLAFATVALVKIWGGTITNGEGNFSLSISEQDKDDSVYISYVGYKRAAFPVQYFFGNDTRIVSLEVESKILLQLEVHESRLSASELLKQAVAKIPDNYQQTPFLFESFYREKYKILPKKFTKDGIEKKRGSGYKITEAIFDLYQPGYNRKQSGRKVQLSLIKSRQLTITKDDDPESDSLMSARMKTLQQKSGPFSAMDYDLRDLDSFDFLTDFEKYDYVISRSSDYYSHTVIKIDFDQKENVRDCKYKGSIFVEAQSLAIVEVDFQYSSRRPEKAFRLKILGIEIRYLNQYGRITFKPFENYWVLHYVKGGLLSEITVDRKKKGAKVFLNAEFDHSFEVLNIRIKQTNSAPLPEEKLFMRRDVLDKFVSDDPDFWKGYSVILPERKLYNLDVPVKSND